MSRVPDADRQDQVVLLDSVPGPHSDDSDPLVVANERRVVIAYRIDAADSERFGPFDEDDDPFCAVVFSGAAFHQFGPPSDGDLHAHPLASEGLRGFSVHEIMNSSLVADSWGPASSHGGLRHFVFTLRDSTFECVAADCTVAGIYGNSDMAARGGFLTAWITKWRPVALRSSFRLTSVVRHGCRDGSMYVSMYRIRRQRDAPWSVRAAILSDIAVGTVYTH